MAVDSKFGLKIYNYEAAVLTEMQLGIRDCFSRTEAVLKNSLLLDFLLANGLQHSQGETKDVVCIQFNYGTTDYRSHVSKLKKTLRSFEKIEDEKDRKQKVHSIELAMKHADKFKERFTKRSKEELRFKIYEEGIQIVYPDGETIRYFPAYRSAGKAKVGEVMCVREELFEDTLRFLRMGLELPDHDAKLVEISAYSALISSSIVERVVIDPDEILVVEDVDSYFNTNVWSVETDEETHCFVREIEDYSLKNTLFDGQALIDESIFPSWAHDYVLLRQHFTKCAAFHSRIQRFFKDKFGDKYETTYLEDMWGRKVKASKIKLICTDTTLKFLKFDVSFDYWAEWVRKNGSRWGIVKTAHPSKIGYGLQRASYQICNSLSLDSMDMVMADSIQYVKFLKTDDEFFLDYLNRKKTFFNDYEPLLALVEQDPSFINSEYFKERRASIIAGVCKKIKGGKLLLNAENLVIVGSPYAMLLAAIGEDPFEDKTFEVEDGSIQCYTKRFHDGEYLAFMRSPFNGFFNMSHLHNKYHPLLEKYFRFGELVIAVNLIGTDFQDRNNGSDQDSDFGYTTNHPDVVAQAKYCVDNYPTVVNNIPKDTSHYNNTSHDMAVLDNKISAGQMDIGLSSNVCQLSLSYSFNMKDRKFLEGIAILSVLAQAAIDSAKRMFATNISKEIELIQRKIDIQENGLPKFWVYYKGTRKRNKEAPVSRHAVLEDVRTNVSLDCPMNYLYDFKFPRQSRPGEVIPNRRFFVNYPIDVSRKTGRKIERLIEEYSAKVTSCTIKDDREGYGLLEKSFDELLEKINGLHIPKDCIGLMAWLLNRALYITEGAKKSKTTTSSVTSQRRPLLMKVLYNLNKDCFLRCFQGNLMMLGAQNVITEYPPAIF